MSNYAITRCTNGAFKVEGEYSDEKAAKVAFHNFCSALWNEKTVDVDASVALLNENLNKVMDEKIVVVQPKPEQQQGE